ncbi:MAG: hypothetical protein J0L86_05340 [Flavobacteriales bacterium]|nr:hypothetical protein [Flavobacteriales bacterium]
MDNSEKNNDNKHLAWFLGSKGENSDFFIKILNSIIQDYVHWRRNYYPSDSILINKKLQRLNEEEYDKIYQNNIEMMSLLRRNFPFYSPRYIGHMLSDISMPSMFGYFAGMLYNSNNVTPEAAPVTVEWEIDACNEILKMLGYKESPSPPSKEAPVQEWKAYKKNIKDEFGWAHITSGGTVANIEALWVARTIKYFPLAIRDVAIQKDIELEIKQPNPTLKPIDIKKMKPEDLLHIKPNESIYLFSKFIDAIAKKEYKSIEKASELALDLLSKSKYSLSNSLGNVFKEFPPVIFTSGAAHYSIQKAADILGIGRSNVIKVKTDGLFRLDVKDLKVKMNSAIKSGKYPIAIVAIGSTTEEGAVDPIHEIIEYREELEIESNKSFWLHIDSAWGGYVSTIFRLDENEELNIILDKISRKIRVNLESNSNHLHSIKLIIQQIINNVLLIDETSEAKKTNEHFKNSLQNLLEEIEIKSIDANEVLLNFKKIVFNFGGSIYLFENKKLFDCLLKEDFEININDRTDDTSTFVSDDINFSLNNYKREKKVKWSSKHVVSSFLAFKNADSITVDPHKLGYIQYPCGIISFKNDRIRHFIMQRAPYITSSGHNALLHNPPRHIQQIDFNKLEKNELPYNDYKIGIDAFAPFMLEGSKPGAAAASLWFSSKNIPLNRKNHGLIIKDTLLATRELYEWLITWEKIYSETGENEKLLYEFKTFGTVPDTNVLVFAIKSKMNDTIKGMNELTESVYNNFSIQAELGAKDHSYSQSFFISKTKMDESHYSFESFKTFFENCNLKSAKKDYLDNGLLILRATLMNPYISSIRRNTNQNLIKEFVLELHKAANSATKKILLGSVNIK